MPRSPRAPTSTITSSTSACAAWSRRRKEKGTHIIGSYTDRCGTDPLYVAYSITGTGYQVQYAIDEAVKGTWKPGYKEFGLKMGPEASGHGDLRRYAPNRRPSSTRS